MLTLHIKEGIKASDVGEYGQHSSQPIKTAVNYAPYQRHFFPHHLWKLRNAPWVAAARGNESERWGVLMTDPGLVKICFCFAVFGAL